MTKVWAVREDGYAGAFAPAVELIFAGLDFTEPQFSWSRVSQAAAKRRGVRRMFVNRRNNVGGSPFFTGKFP
jgi:hypothetical protein